VRRFRGSIRGAELTSVRQAAVEAGMSHGGVHNFITRDDLPYAMRPCTGKSAPHSRCGVQNPFGFESRHLLCSHATT
jgi:hypothetical protein